MPIYEYQCQGCGGKFEVIQKFSDEPLTKHEACGGGVRRLIGSPALQFKGSGWYVNDYAKSGAKSEKSEKSDKSESKPAAKEGAGSNGGGESKPAAAESKPAASTSTETKSS